MTEYWVGQTLSGSLELPSDLLMWSHLWESHRRPGYGLDCPYLD